MYQEQVPRSREENLAFRLRLLDAVRDEGDREAIRRMCREDMLFYVNAFAWTFDPETEEKVLPFVTWPAQEAALREVEASVRGRYDLVIEKSRRQGGSWLSLLVMEWFWHFHPWNQFLMVSRSALMVDGNTPDALFWKLDFLHDHLPSWLMPKGWNPKRHRLVNYFENPENGSTMTGQATTERAGVGGRATAMFVDEFSRIKEDQELLDATADTSRCRIFNSTHTGTGTAFYRLTRREDVRKLRLHWSENPSCNAGLYRWSAETNKPEPLDLSYTFPRGYEYDRSGGPSGGPYPGVRSPWYDGECRRRGSSRAVATDLDINPSGSMSQVFDPLLISALVKAYCRPPWWQGDVEFERVTGRPSGLVSKAGGKLKLWVQLKPDGSPPEGTYAVGADISTGQGATPSCLAIGDCKTGEKVAEFADARVDPLSLAPLATALCWLFRQKNGAPAKLIWEHVGPGQSFGGRVLELGFPNAWMGGKGLPQSVKEKESDRPGWIPDKDSKRHLLLEYASALSLRQYLNRSEQALEECLMFRYDARGEIEHSEQASRDDPSGARVNHGDRVIADALCWKAIKAAGLHGPTAPRPDQSTRPGTLAWRERLAEEREREAALWA